MALPLCLVGPKGPDTTPRKRYGRPVERFTTSGAPRSKPTKRRTYKSASSSRECEKLEFELAVKRRDYLPRSVIHEGGVASLPLCGIGF